MKQVKVKNLKGNEITALPIVTDSGTVLIHADVVLNSELINRIRSLGIQSLSIKEYPDEIIDPGEYGHIIIGTDDKLGEDDDIYSDNSNGTGIDNDNNYNKEIENNKYKIFNICNEYDYVNIIMHSVSNKIFIKSVTNIGNEDNRYSKIIHRLGGVHSPYSMFKKENGILTLNDVVEQSEIMKNLEKLFEYYNANMKEEDNQFMYYRMSLLMMKSGKEVFGEECPIAPKGFSRRFIKLTRDFTKNESGLDSSEIINLFKPILSDIGSIIIKGKISENSR